MKKIKFLTKENIYIYIINDKIIIKTIMISSSLFSINDKIDNNSTKNYKNDKLFNESIISFKAFDSVLL